MGANIDPLFPLTPKIAFGTQTTANTAKDGTGTVVPVFTAGANGSRFDKVIAVPIGTNTASVLRIFLNNGGANSTATNNSLIGELSLPATTLSEVAAQTPLEYVFNLPLTASYVINTTIGTTVAAGWKITGVGGDY